MSTGIYFDILQPVSINLQNFQIQKSSSVHNWHVSFFNLFVFFFLRKQ